MAVQAVPTKGNLINTKKSLALAKVGYELLDRKRNILIREMMSLIEHANAIQDKIDNAYSARLYRTAKGQYNTWLLRRAFTQHPCGRQYKAFLSQRYGR